MSNTSVRAARLGPGDLDEVVTEIKALTNQVAAVTSRFSSIRRMLSRAPLDPEDKFSQYHKQYIELVWKSRQIAGEAHVAASDFCGDIFDMILDNTIPDSDKRIELEGVMENWKSTGASSSQLFQDFEDLCRTLDSFSVALGQCQDITRHREAALEADIDGVTDRLSKLSTSKHCQSRESIISASRLGALFRNICRQLSENGLFGMMFMTISTVMSLAYTAACTLFGLSMVLVKSSISLSPRMAIEAISKTISDGFAELLRLESMLTVEDRSGNSEREELEATLTARRAALDEVFRTVNLSSEALEETSVLKSDVVSLSSQLSSLCDIFNILTHECFALLGITDSGTSITSHGTELRAVRDKLLPIDQALDAYAKAKDA